MNNNMKKTPIIFLILIFSLNFVMAQSSTQYPSIQSPLCETLKSTIQNLEVSCSVLELQCTNSLNNLQSLFIDWNYYYSQDYDLDALDRANEIWNKMRPIAHIYNNQQNTYNTLHSFLIELKKFYSSIC